MRQLCIPAATLLAVALPATPAWTQSASQDRVIQSLTRCRTIALPAASLECFEKATAELETAVATKVVIILDRGDIQTARRSLFGFTLPRIGLFRGGADGDTAEQEFEELSTTIASVRSLANGRMELRLAEGDAVWVTTDPMNFPPTPGKKLRIRKGALGNYFIAIDGLRSVRGMRVR